MLRLGWSILHCGGLGFERRISNHFILKVRSNTNSRGLVSPYTTLPPQVVCQSIHPSLRITLRRIGWLQELNSQCRLFDGQIVGPLFGFGSEAFNSFVNSYESYAAATNSQMILHHFQLLYPCEVSNRAALSLISSREDLESRFDTVDFSFTVDVWKIYDAVPAISDTQASTSATFQIAVQASLSLLRSRVGTATRTQYANSIQYKRHSPVQPKAEKHQVLYF